MTACWHVDDLKVSHMEELVVTELALKLAKIYGPNPTISRGKVHNYKGMEMNFGTNPGTMSVYSQSSAHYSTIRRQVIDEK